MRSKWRRNVVRLTVETDTFTIVTWILISFYGVTHRAEALSTGTTTSGCQHVNPGDLERRLRDEGDFDHRYMASDLTDALDRFTDLADAKFVQAAEQYSCDSQCEEKARSIRSVFAKYGQIPTSVSVPDFNSGMAFADVREVLEGRLAQPGQLAGGTVWNGGVFPNGRLINPMQPTIFQSAPVQQAQPVQQQAQPLPVQQNQQQPQQAQPIQQGQLDQQLPTSPQPTFLPISLNSAFPLATATPTPTPPSGSLHNDDYEEDNGRRSSRKRNRHRGGSWFMTGEMANNSSAESTSRRQRRQRNTPTESTSLGQSMKIRCSKKGDEEEPGLHTLCGTCRVIRELPPDFFPRYLNEASCSGPVCFDKSTTGGGHCVEQFINFDILHNVGTGDCPKWETHTIAVPVCCSCLMSDALAQYLAMPWVGQKLSTERPNRGGPG